MTSTSNNINYRQLLKNAYLELTDMRSKLDAIEQARTEPIAIVGMGCRFPGGANNPEAFWNLLSEGRHATQEVPANRWDINFYYDPDPDVPGKMYTRYGGFLDEVDKFDPQFFGISPREATSIDPQQRLLLEVTWEALENASIAVEGLRGSQTGVFIGVGFDDYSQLSINSGDPGCIDAYTLLGNSQSIAAGRLSYILGLQGPTMQLDTTCSSSLLGVHLACSSLRSKECNLAIAGGVNLMLSPTTTIGFCKLKALAADGRCKSFDANADGYVRGEGCGIIVLKRLGEAIKDGDNILALIKGSAVNHDGQSNGLTAPNGSAQEAVIRQALFNAGVEPTEIQYVEAHGTGTPLGDPIEVLALGKVLAQGRSEDDRLAIGSVKTNIGHLEAAAGIASLMKVVLALQHKLVPPTLHLKEPNPYIPWQKLPIEVTTVPTPWTAKQKPRLAGVSSFGMSGTNVHLILEEASIGSQNSSCASSAPKVRLKIQDANVVERPYHLLTLSAKTESALQELVSHYQAYLKSHPEASIADVCFSANTGRSHFTHRLAVVARTTPELGEKLSAVATGNETVGLVSGQVSRKRPKIAFLFTGQGSQYINMGRELYDTQPIFRQTLDQCDEILRPLLKHSLLEVLYPAQIEEQEEKLKRWLPPLAQPAAGIQTSPIGDATRTGSKRTGEKFFENSPSSSSSTLPIDQTAYTQPALFAFEYALYQLWKSWGIEPDVVMGHSVGEYVAATVAGIFSLEDGLKLIAHRGQLMQQLPPGGEMISLIASEEQVRQIIAPYERTVAIAAINGSESVVISGASEEIGTICHQLEALLIKTKRLQVSHAFHSPLMTPMLKEFEQVANHVTYKQPQIPLVSNVTGRPADEQITTAQYWVNHVLQAVRFADSMQTLHQQGYKVFLEIGPKPILLSMGYQCLPDSEGLWLPSLRSGVPEWQQLLFSLSELYVAGVKVDWLEFERDYLHEKVALPTYPFQRQRYWIQQVKQTMNEKDLAVNGKKSTFKIDATPTPSRLEEILARLQALVGNLLQVSPADVNIHAPFLEMGADSIILVEAVRRIENTYGIKIAIGQLFEELTTIYTLATYIDQKLSPQRVEPDSLQQPEQPISTQSTPESSLPSTQDFEHKGTAAPETTLERIMTQQLQVMSQQLEVLRGNGSSEKSLLSSKNGQLQSAQTITPAVDSPQKEQHNQITQATPSATPTKPELKQPSHEPFSPLSSFPGADIPGKELSLQQQHHIEVLSDRYNKRHQKSKQLAQSYRPVLADSRATAGFRLSIKEMVYPIAGERSQGSRFWDVDGNEYVDITMGFGVLLFGHDPQFVTEPVQKHYQQSLKIGPQSKLAGEVAQLICELTGMERVTFCNSGTEAVMTALRLARSATGRTKIALFAGSYHGQFDGILATAPEGKIKAVPLASGVSQNFVENVLVLDYGNPKSIEILQVHAQELAAVLVEPVQSRRPDLQPKEFLQQLRQLTQASGTALIFDEVLTGFRIHPGGAQAWFGIEADIVTYGKIIGGGTPIGVVAGKATYMNGIDGGLWNYGDASYPQAEKIFFAGTFNKNHTGMVAALAVLQHLKKQGTELQQQLNQRTSQLVQTLNSYFEEEDVPIRIVHFGSLFRFTFPGNLDLFFYHLIDKGVYIWEGRNCFLSTAHTDADINYVIQAVKDSVKELREGGFLPSGLSESLKTDKTTNETLSDLTPALSDKNLTPSALFWGRDECRLRDYMPTASEIGDRLLSEFTQVTCQQNVKFYGEAVAQLEALSITYVLRAFQQMGWKFQPGRRFSTKFIVKQLGIIEQHQRLLERLLEMLAEEKVLHQVNDHWEVTQIVEIQNPQAQEIAFLAQYPKVEAELTLLQRCGQKLAQVLQGECHPLELLFPKGNSTALTKLYQDSPGSQVMNTLVQKAVSEVLERFPQECRVRILEIGGGTGGTTSYILPQLLDHQTEYVFTDVSPVLISKAQKKFGDYPFVRYEILDIEQDPKTQASDFRQYDLIIAANVLHATKDLRQTLKHIHQLLVPGGLLVLLEVTVRQRWLDLTFGLTEGWWKFADLDLRPSSPLLSPYQWQDLLKESQFREVVTIPNNQGKVGIRSKQTVVIASAASEVPLTEAQKQLWMLAQLGEDSSVAYNESVTLQLRGSLNATAMSQAIQKLVDRHEALRTKISPKGDVQEILPTFKVDCPVLDFSCLEGDCNAQVAEWLDQESRKPFDLSNGSLLCVHLLKLEPELHLLVLTAHHIVIDGWSIGVILRELGALYSAESQGMVCHLNPPKQFREYIEWQNKHCQMQEMKAHQSYWLEKLTAPLVLDLPTDRTRPPIKTYHVSGKTIKLDAQVTKNLKLFSQQQGCTLLMILLSVYTTLIHRLTGQDDIIVGVPTSGRSLLGGEGMVGYCAHFLPIRSELAGNPTFVEYLKQMRGNLLEAYEHQDYSFAQLLNQLNLPRDTSRSPLVDVSFNLEPPITLPQMSQLDVNLLPQVVNFKDQDLHLNVAERAGELLLECNYNTDLFDAYTIERWLSHFQTLLQAIVTEPEQHLRKLPLLTADQRHQLLVEWNDTQAEYPFDKCIHQLFESQVKRTPDAVAVVFENVQTRYVASLTYRELNAKANQLAHYLQTLGVGADVLVGLCVERSLLMVVGLLGILKAGGAYVPLDPEYPQERLNFMLEDAQVQVLLTQQHLLERLPEYHAPLHFGLPRLRSAQVAQCRVCLDTDWQLISQSSDLDLVNSNTRENLAYVIYTSGSTGQPKGVMIQHHSLVNITQTAIVEYGLSNSDRSLQFSSISFDVAAAEIYPCLSCGATLVLRTDEMLSSVQTFIEKCRDWNLTVLDLPTAYWYQVTSELANANLLLPDCIRLVTIGGEPLLKQQLRIWQQHIGEYPQLINAYGPTETTVAATLCKLSGSATTEIDEQKIPIGHPIHNTQIYILDQYLQPVPIGIAGELHIGGAGLARGYLNRPELTQEKFIPNSFSTDSDSRLYKTGDLAHYLPDGNIEYLGRIDNQVKIRGFRIELGEIEAVLNQHSDVQTSCVIARKDTLGVQRLVAYVIPNLHLTPASPQLRQYLSSQLPLYMVPNAFVVLETLPLTSNGKVDYRSLPAPDLASQMLDKFVAPHTSIEKTVAQIWTEVLRIEQVGIHNNFFELGGHSLLATQVISRLQSAFQISLPLRYLFKSPTVAQLSDAILAELQTDSGLTLGAIVPVPREKDIPLSWAQERLWFLHHLEGESGAYTMSCALRLVGNLNVKALEGALQEIVRRHEVLRTRFAIKDDKPVQAIAPHITITLPVVDLQNVPDSWKQVEQQAKKEARKPFDLANDSVLRVMLWRVSQDEYILLLAIHHIAADGWSIGVLNRELSVHYRAISAGSSAVLPELSVQYADFAVWQRQWLTNQVLERQLSYWKQELAGAPPLLELPTDRSRPAVQTFRGGVERFQIDGKLTQQLRQIGQESEATLFMTLLAGFVVLLSRYSGQTDLVVGSPIANRNRKETEPLIGFFVNTLALRFDLSQEPSFEALLAQVRQVTLNAYEHQDLPFEILVEELQPERKLNRNPLVQVAFALQNAPTSDWDLPGLSVEQMLWHLDTVRVDLELHFWETLEGLNGFCCYSSDLFDAAMIARMMQHYQTLLAAIVPYPEQPVNRLPLLTAAEQQQLLVEWNTTQTDYPTQCLHQLFESFVEQNPDAVAVVFEAQQLTYGQLNAQANQLANYLQKQGVKPEMLVGICVERSLSMIVGLLGILKAGGAYVPLDPKYPSDRIAYMLSDAQLQVLVTQSSLADRFPKHQAQVVYLDADWGVISQESEENPVSGVQLENLAYVIYTSGSTGKPKGVLVAHQGLCNLAAEQIRLFDVQPDSRILQFASLSFDASIWEIAMAFGSGARLVLGTSESLLPGENLMQLLHDQSITHITLPPSALAVLPAERLPALQYIIVAGEALSADLVAQWSRGRRLFNAYGPTESTVCATVAFCSDGSQKPPIGRPIANTQIYILDDHCQSVPIGVPGELHIGGIGLARGYINRPELTAEKFIRHPFSSKLGDREACAKHSRLYKTGDKARYLSDGNIEFLGRIDHQVKVRGFRIETGEVEAVLSQHPLVRESVVVAREDIPGDQRTSASLSTSLVAYLVPDLKGQALSEQVYQWQNEYVSDWQTLYEQAYSQSQASTDDLTFNIAGWNSSYTKLAIPAQEMQEWVESTVERILSLLPQRVLEIGCGTGLLLSRVAQRCQQYWGTDYSKAALQYVERLCHSVEGLENVRLLHKTADNFEDIPTAEFDTVILNSVIQYFPSVEYLLQVLEGVMATIGDQGTIFVGDVRSLPLLEPYHAAVQLSQVPESKSVEQWQQQVHQSIDGEEELLIDPSFFIALQQRFSQITWVEIQPKRGRFQNELSQFRYDVTLHVNTNVQTLALSKAEVTIVPWLNWQLDKLSFTQIQNQLLQEQPELLGIRRVPNQRVQQALQIWQWLEHPPGVETVSQLRQLLAQQSAGGINPEEFWQLGQQLNYTVHLSWWESSQDGCYDLVFCRNSTQTSDKLGAMAFWDRETVTTKPWTNYTNNPLQGKLVRKLVPQVREFIQQKLPNYMVPQAFVLLNALPLTPNGKVDRRSLPTPDTATRNLSTSFVLPRTPIEAQLTQIWSEVLRLERIGVKDNFFEIGGHSLLATQVISRVNSAFGLNLPIQTMFESPTVAGLAAYVKVMDWATQNLPVTEVSGEIVEF
ncbi:non-ribosomal peptide synthetase/type I polyketide synthase [Nostoc sp. LPT]|uniref:non-ribosomal peptide synthetase/type I polyketide synthase n=1 Tax=Nostoc sp. LPT TaxID=2815387 RepID=UPI0025E6998E|nr:non-ribosomal peptide synthetase/type I polyketide synthase [Nostoc sp. LPT]